MQHQSDLGKLISVHAIQPVYVQRAAFVVILSFIFFLLSMFIYYIRQSALYFLLATAFMGIYIITMISWVLQRKRVVELHENGIRFRGRPVPWAAIREVRDDQHLDLKTGKSIVLPQTLNGLEELMASIRRGVAGSSR